MAAGNTELGSAFVTIYPQIDRNFRTTASHDINRSIDHGALSAGGTAAGGSFGKGFKNAALVALETLGDFLQDFVHWAMNIVGDLTREAISNEDALIKFSNSMSFAGFDTGQIEELQQQMMEYADSTIFELSDIVSLTGQLGAIGVDNFEQLAEAAGNLTAVAGYGATEFGYFQRALSQINTAGVLKTQDFMQVQNAIGAGAVKIQEELIAMGAFEGGMERWSEALANGEISAEEFNQAVMNLGMQDAAIEAATSTDTFEGAMAQLRAASVSAIMQIIETIGMENITGFISKLAELVPPMIEKVAPLVEELANKFLDWIMNMDTEEAAENFGKFFDLMVDVVPALIGYMSPLIGIVRDLHDAITWLKDTLTPIFDAVGEFFGGVWESMSEKLSGIKDTLQELWDKVSGFWETLSGVFTGITDFLSQFNMENIKATVTEGVTYIRDYFSTKFDEVKTKVSGVFEAIRQAIAQKLEAARQAVANAIDRIKACFDFDWHLPHLKLPHIIITGEWSLNPPSYPHFDVEWRAKGGIFNSASIIGVGEAGPEAVVPLSGSAMQPFALEVASNMGLDGLAEQVAALRQDVRNVKLYLDGSTLVGGIADRMDTALGGRQASTARGF